MRWEKIFGNRGSDNLKAILTVKDGGYVLAGHTTLPETGTTNGSMDFWVVRIDEQGQKVWDKSYGGSGAEPLFGYNFNHWPGGNLYFMLQSG